VPLLNKGQNWKEDRERYVLNIRSLGIWPVTAGIRGKEKRGC